MTETTTTFKPHEEIQKLLNSLDKNETDVNKVSDVTHKCLLIMSVRNATKIINTGEKTKDDDDNDEKMKMFDEIVQKCYLIKLESLKKKLLN